MKTAHTLSTLLTLALVSLACAGNPHPQALRRSGPAPLHLPWAEAGLTRREAAAHLLNRFSYGPRPGDVDAVAAMGPERWLEQQLAANLPEPALARRLAAYPALSMTAAEILCAYPNDGAVRTEAKKAGILPGDQETEDAEMGALPGEEREKAVRAILDGYAERQGYRPQREILDQLGAQKLLRAVYAENQLAELLTDFWFNHFNVSWTNDRARPYLVAFERDAIRPNALGSFRRLLGATAHQPAMLLYLDNAQSVAPRGAPTTFGDEMAAAQDGQKADQKAAQKKKPAKPDAKPAKPTPGINENYARELMELHTLGVDGGYTQQDVIEVARAFTGWTVLPADLGAMKRIGQRMEQEREIGGGAFRREGGLLFRADVHDAGPKTVLGHPLPAGRGIEDGEEVLDLLARHPATAHHLAYQLAVRFVADHPSPDLVDRLAGVYRESGGDVRAVVRAIAESREFWSPAARGAKVKSPFELAVSALRALGAEVSDPKPTVAWISKLGEPLYSYQPPTGYPDRAEAWLNAGTLLARMNFGLRLATGKVAGVKVDLAALSDPQKPRSFQEALAVYPPLLLPLSLDPEREAGALTRLAASGGSPKPVKGTPTPAQQVVGLLLGSPEFQRR
jgi:uncharacterized protein (DUF1800 family)